MKKQININLEEETYKALQELANQENRSLSQMARLIIEKAVNKRKSVKVKEL